MRKRAAILLLLWGLALLPGCEGHYPAQAVDGTPWEKSWTILGTTLGVEEPGHGLVLSENPVVLTGDDTHYAVWTAGEAETTTNDEGKEAQVYDAALYLLLYGCGDGESARGTVEDWLAREREVYEVTDTRTEVCNGQEYQILLYHTRSETNPYDKGAVAFGVFQNYAVSAELTCRERFSEDEFTVLTDFLDGCHYAAD